MSDELLAEPWYCANSVQVWFACFLQISFSENCGSHLQYLVLGLKYCLKDFHDKREQSQLKQTRTKCVNG